MYVPTHLRPDVNLAGLLVEEENVLQEHESTRLANGREETVKNACRHERLKRCGPGAPRGCRG